MLLRLIVCGVRHASRMSPSRQSQQPVDVTPPPSTASDSNGTLMARAWVENRPANGTPLSRYNLRELWAYRDVGIILAQRDVKVRYKQTFFGAGWAILQPLSAMVLFTLVLGSRGVGLPSQGLPYSAFVLVGLAVWFPFNMALTTSSESLTQHPALVTKVYFPRLLAPLGAVCASVLDLAISTTIALVFSVVVGVPLQPTAPLVLVGVLWFILIAVGFGSCLSCLNVLYRDVRYVLGFSIQVLFFASPIVYPSTLTHGALRALLALNPLVGLIDFFRWAILGAPLESSTALISLGATVVLLIPSLLFFQRMERRFADRI
jgi:homopolymeric O-antigen transport system permease protein